MLSMYLANRAVYRCYVESLFHRGDVQKGEVMKRWLLACLTMLCMVALLVGCGNDTAKDSKQGKHMNVGLYWFGETLDPTHEWDAWTLTRIGAGETLAVVTPDMKFAPQLADSWENVDPTTWKFHIRENVKFQNGTPMTPQKVKRVYRVHYETKCSFCRKLLRSSLSR